MLTRTNVLKIRNQQPTIRNFNIEKLIYNTQHATIWTPGRSTQLAMRKQLGKIVFLPPLKSLL